MLGVMAVGLAVLLVLVIAHWRTIVDHVEAWRFQSAHETTMIEPDPRVNAIPMDHETISLRFLLLLFATRSGRPVIFPSRDDGLIVGLDFATRRTLPDTIQAAVQAQGYRVLEQRFPMRAYVVIRDRSPPAQAESPMLPRPAVLKHPQGIPRLTPEERERILKRP